MNFMTPPDSRGAQALVTRLRAARAALKPPPDLDLVEWADEFRHIASKNSATPGKWKTSSQPCAFGPMRAVTDPEVHTVTVMAATQVVKSELALNAAFYFIHQDPSPILFVQPSQGAAAAFSKERFTTSVSVSPVLRKLLPPSRKRDSENTIVSKSFPGGGIDFVGSNSPTDLSSRPKRIIVCDEIDKYPASAGDEGDPLGLAEERASTYHAVGRAKFIRVCSPTNEETSRIGREYKAGDQRKCFPRCPHCGEAQVLTWANVVWSRNAAGEHLPETAGISCGACGAVWTEKERLAALAALEHEPDHGWRQTKPFVCCEERQSPERWNDKGRSMCRHCGALSRFDGHASFHIPKWLSKRHRLPTLVKSFLDADGNPDLMKKVVNTGFAELWVSPNTEKLDGSGLIDRREPYGPDDLPEGVVAITSFTDVQGDRLETQFVGWGADEESWPFLYEVTHEDPAQPRAWEKLADLLRQKFTTRDGRVLRVAAAGIDTGGHHGAQVFSFCRRRRGQKVFPCKGVAGKRPVWPLQATRSKTNEKLWLIGVDSAKDAVYGRLKIDPPDPGGRMPGFIHFPETDAFGQDYFAQLTSERREIRKRMGQPVTVWVLPEGKRNEALDTMVGALAVRRSLPRRIERALEFSGRPARREDKPADPTETPPEDDMPIAAQAEAMQAAPRARQQNFLGRRRGWLSPR
ncbi:phage terminase large subunit family protein [Chelatococcus reniformis]|uniref:Terminase n=1 Tax=Chelatococcus reniformis TaxID=1494448 RepID=A0A916XGS6_9HYPH|nr:terminase gpA endonuclease subunit [Chelatococcus reniformis]GGC70720.1 terminase [Chelatococcus reniformis]